jgi:hypothetical protein
MADPSEHRLVGVFLDAVAAARATPPADLPRGPHFFRFSDDEEFAAALRQQDLASPVVTGIKFMQRFASTDEPWHGMLDATVRASALITRQPEDVRQRIRAAFDRLADGYDVVTTWRYRSRSSSPPRVSRTRDDRHLRRISEADRSNPRAAPAVRRSVAVGERRCACGAGAG